MTGDNWGQQEYIIQRSEALIKELKITNTALGVMLLEACKCLNSGEPVHPDITKWYIDNKDRVIK